MTKREAQKQIEMIDNNNGFTVWNVYDTDLRLITSFVSFVLAEKFASGRVDVSRIQPQSVWITEG